MKRCSTTLCDNNWDHFWDFSFSTVQNEFTRSEHSCWPGTAWNVIKRETCFRRRKRRIASHFIDTSLNFISLRLFLCTSFSLVGFISILGNTAGREKARVKWKRREKGVKSAGGRRGAREDWQTAKGKESDAREGGWRNREERPGGRKRKPAQYTAMHRETNIGRNETDALSCACGCTQTCGIRRRGYAPFPVTALALTNSVGNLPVKSFFFCFSFFASRDSKSLESAAALCREI